MKIGVLTYHRSVNDGSVLQALCLQRLLRELAPEGARVEVVDVRDRLRERMEMRRLVTKRPPFLRVATWRKMRGLRTFLRRHVALSPVSITTPSLAAARDFVLSQNYDVLVVGSDTVWQLRRFGDADPPHLFYLPGFEGVKKVAFAVSADPIQDRSLLQDAQRSASLRTAIEAFDFIGVRDRPTTEMLTGLGVEPGRLTFTPDPTICTDFSDLVRRPQAEERPAAGVALASAKLRREVSGALLERGFEVVNHLGAPPPGTRPLSGKGALPDRLGRFAEQALLVTDRFHSSIFTLKLGKAPVIFTESPGKWPEPNSKGRDLLERLGCGEFVWRPGEELAPFLDRAEKWREDPPDMASRFTSLRAESSESLDRLRQLLR